MTTSQHAKTKHAAMGVEFRIVLSFDDLPPEGPHGVPGATIRILTDIAHQIAGGRRYSAIQDGETGAEIGHWCFMRPGSEI